MAVYIAVVTMDHPRPERISKNFSMMVGKCNITTYSKTGVEITDITKWFDDTTVPIVVICDGLSTTGYLIRWDRTDKCFHAFDPTAAHLHLINLSAVHAGNAIELSANSNGAALGEAGGVGYTGITGIQNNTVAPGSEAAETIGAVGEVNFIAIGWSR
jgi:hypothetical protein